MSEIEIYEQTEDAEIVPAQHGTLFGTDDPVAVVEKATRVASALMDTVKRHDAGKPPAKRLVSVISGREFPKLECWTLLGTMLGVFPVLEGEPERIEIDGVSGWKLTVAAQTRDGAVVGRASALCMRSESNWRTRDEYALASMSQTRAASKALSQPLRFVMVLAGLEGTPEAEMPPASSQEAAGARPEVRLAATYREWVDLMTTLEVPRPEEWAAAAAEQSGVAKEGRMQRLNVVLEHFTLNEPKGAAGFFSVAEVQAGFAAGFDGVVPVLPAAPVEPEPGASDDEDPAIEFAPIQ